MTHSIKHLLHIASSQENVFENLTTIKGLSQWWTTETSGSTELGGIIEFRFSEWVNKMKVIASKPNELVKWECVQGADEWLGAIISFHLDRNENKTRIRFEHDKWNTQDDFYASCSFSWGKYLESLRQLCQTGKGEAFGSSNYRI